MNSTVQEKRRFPRKQLDKPAEVLDNDTGLSIGILENVSRGGFSLVTDRGIRPSEVRNVTLILPGPHESQHNVSLIAECVWCQSINEEKDYAAGFSLCDIPEQDAVALNYFIRDYKVTG
ncbi:PilZ domain-containing protein [Endozoicomonas sp. Mp262]|uniref:PilZ domain-containing protein n=1 Tax=Endozoicomonas sp. Mp262 TaxID=2919499 RepID=UPI0021D8139D